MLKYDNELELVTSDISFNSVCLSRLANLNLYSNLFGWQLFPIYFHLKFPKNANNTNFGSLEKTRLRCHMKSDIAPQGESIGHGCQHYFVQKVTFHDTQSEQCQQIMPIILNDENGEDERTC